MSILKTDKERLIERAAPVEKNTSVVPTKPVEITALEIAADLEVGCDPYNSTGQFLAEELRRYQE